MMLLHTTYTFFAFLIGAVLGSFWNVAISRWPEDRSVIRPASACPNCNVPIHPTDNLPILSWVLLRGACRTCAWPIPATYPLTELLGGLLGWLLFKRFVPTPADLDAAHLAAFAVFLLFASALCIGAFIDVRHKILPDEVTIGFLPVGVLGAVVLQSLGYTGAMSQTWQQSVGGAVCGAVLFGGMALAAWAITRREALGVGDVKMLTMIGAFTGPMGVYWVSLGAAMSGSLVGLVVTIVARRRVFVPFGPMLAFWSIAYVLYSQA